MTSLPAQLTMRIQLVCGYIPDAYTDAGACVQAGRLWQLSPHLHIIADKIDHTGGNLCGFGILEKFSYLYIEIESLAYRMHLTFEKGPG